MSYGGVESSTSERPPTAERSRTRGPQGLTIYGTDEATRDGYQEPEVSKPRLAGCTSSTVLPPWYARIRNWETVCGIPQTHICTKKKWYRMVEGMMDAGYGGVRMPTDYNVKPRKGHQVIARVAARLRKDAIAELMEEETPEVFFPIKVKLRDARKAKRRRR
eukprot:59639-Amphidinium_carterae.1